MVFKHIYNTQQNMMLNQMSVFTYAQVNPIYSAIVNTYNTRTFIKSSMILKTQKRKRSRSDKYL